MTTTDWCAPGRAQDQHDACPGYAEWPRPRQCDCEQCQHEPGVRRVPPILVLTSLPPFTRRAVLEFVSDDPRSLLDPTDRLRHELSTLDPAIEGDPLTLYRGVPETHGPHQRFTSWTDDPDEAACWGPVVLTEQIASERVLAVVLHTELDITEYVVMTP